MFDRMAAAHKAIINDVVEYPCGQCGTFASCNCVTECNNCGDAMYRADAVEVNEENYAGIYGTVLFCQRCA